MAGVWDDSLYGGNDLENSWVLRRKRNWPWLSAIVLTTEKAGWCMSGGRKFHKEDAELKMVWSAIAIAEATKCWNCFGYCGGGFRVINMGEWVYIWLYWASSTSKMVDESTRNCTRERTLYSICSLTLSQWRDWHNCCSRSSTDCSCMTSWIVDILLWVIQYSAPGSASC